MAKEKSMRLIATNRKAAHNYELTDRLEAGIVLVGTEIKSLRQKGAVLNESFARVVQEEVFVYNCHISPYEQGNRFNVDPVRTRKLLLHRQQIERLIGLTSRKGWSLIPTRLYLKNGIAKIELAVAQGKRRFEKRDTMRKREAQREIHRATRRRR